MNGSQVIVEEKGDLSFVRELRVFTVEEQAAVGVPGLLRNSLQLFSLPQRGSFGQLGRDLLGDPPLHPPQPW